MKKMSWCFTVILFVLCLFPHSPVLAQNSNIPEQVLLSGSRSAVGLASDSSVLISSYLNMADPRDEWTELLVVADNIDMRNWSLQDNNAAQTTFQPGITFNNIPFWNNMRAGTIIMIWHRQVGSSGTTHPTNTGKSYGYVEVSANNVSWFTGGSFGTAPLYAGNTLNIAAAGDLLELLNASGTFVHALGHKAAFGTSWPPLSYPKLNHKAGLNDGDAVFVCPGGKVDEYGYLSPQDGTNYTAKSSTDLSFGLPNCTSTSSANSDYWRLVRQPRWVNPQLTATANAGNTQVTLAWNAAEDPFPGDGVEGYVLLKNTVNVFGTPVDGHTYGPGDLLGGATVVAILPSSQTLSFVDNSPVPCATGLYYQVYAFRYAADPMGNDYNQARGRAYNETSFGSVHVTNPVAVTPASATTDRDNFCAADPGNITLSAYGGSGTTLKWYTGGCGATLLGTGGTPNNSITILSPSVTTTYYAQWENACGVSACAQATVTVLPDAPVHVDITASANPVCTGTAVDFFASPINPGTAPVYQWEVNGSIAGANNTTYSYIPLDGDIVTCKLISTATCATGNPAASNALTMSVGSAFPVNVTISASENPVCTGTSVKFTADPYNPGTAPQYEWKVNGAPAGTNSQTYTYIPANSDIVSCRLTSNASCASGNPASSNNIVMLVGSALPVSVSITASENPVCTGKPVQFRAAPMNAGSAPVYQWKVNGMNVGASSDTFTYAPADGENVECIVSTNEPCISGSPATSNMVVMELTPALPVSVTLSASPGISVCEGTTVTCTAAPRNGGISPSFQWYLNGNEMGGNGPVFMDDPTNGDVIYCVVSSDLTCVQNNPAISDTLKITISSSLEATVAVAANHLQICPGTPVTFKAEANNEGPSPVYEWLVDGNRVQQGNNPVFNINTLLPGQPVTCNLTSSLSCVAQPVVSSVPVALKAAAGPTVDLTDKDFLCAGINPPLDAGESFAGYLWHDGSTSRFMDITGEGIYRVVVTDSLGCKATDSILVKDCTKNLYVPDAFTPNGDGLNDVFRVFANPDAITGFSMQIFNRWGELIFESNNVAAGWNGIKQGQYCPAGSYIWKIRYKNNPGTPADNPVTDRGIVELVR